MTLTPELKVPNGLTLEPVNKLALKPILNAFNEDPESAYSALPWLDKNKDIRQQIRDMLFDVETQADSDEIHFWSIIDDATNDFVGLIGLGDELQLLHSNYNLGYWVRSKYRRRGITARCVDVIFHWLSSRERFFRINIACDFLGIINDEDYISFKERNYSLLEIDFLNSIDLTIH